jgi:hypothetical protein
MQLKVDREVVLVMAGALAMLFGWLLLTHSDEFAHKYIACEKVQKLDGPRFVVACELPPNSDTEIEIIGMGLGICGVSSVFIGAINISR